MSGNEFSPKKEINPREQDNSKQKNRFAGDPQTQNILEAYLDAFLDEPCDEDMLLNTILALIRQEEENISQESTRILIIDDNVLDLKSMGIALKKVGFKNIIFAEKGKEGIEKAEKERPDLIIIDKFLPDLDGFLVCQAIREIEGYAPRMIGISGCSNAEAFSKGTRWDTDTFISKSADYSKLQSEVKKIL